MNYYKEMKWHKFLMVIYYPSIFIVELLLLISLFNLEFSEIVLTYGLVLAFGLLLYLLIYFNGSSNAKRKYLLLIGAQAYNSFLSFCILPLGFEQDLSIVAILFVVSLSIFNAKYYVKHENDIIYKNNFNTASQGSCANVKFCRICGTKLAYEAVYCKKCGIEQ